MKLYSSIFLLSVISSTLSYASSANLRSEQRNGAIRRNDSSVGDERHECTVTEALGVGYPGHPEPPPMLTCETDESNERFGTIIFQLKGDTDNVLNGHDLSRGDVRISFPISTLDQESNVILVSEETQNDITVTYSGDERRRMNYKPTGKKFMLVVRVTGFTNNGREYKTVTQSSSQLSTDVFHDGNNNLKTVFKRCSAKKLKIKKAKSKLKTDDLGIVGGVIDIELPRDMDICNMNYVDVGNAALDHDKLKKLNRKNSKFTHTMIVTPNDACVNFFNAGAWGQVGGTKTWYPDNTASLPATQVHEIAHNFGMRHSGKITSQGFEEYADPSGYMSNRMRWTLEGDMMCFNAAKMWYFNWYGERHTELIPSTNTNVIDLVALDDIKTGFYTGWDKNSVLKLSGSGEDDLFLMFNRAKGINSEVRADADKVVIIEQKGRTAVSHWKGALGAGQTYTQQNWGNTGKTLVVKSSTVNINSSGSPDYARIEVSLSGSNYQPPARSGRCEDVPNWHDSDGSLYNCAWYSQGNNCAHFGDTRIYNGDTANTACCACKRCEDVPNWHDSDGSLYNCAWYSQGNNCAHFGDTRIYNGDTANTACCACK